MPKLMLKEDKIRYSVKKNEPYLNILEELDRTGKYNKTNYKERVNFTIDEALMIEFRKYCDENSIKMSTKVEKLIKDFLNSTRK